MMDFEKMLVETKLSNEAVDAFTNAARSHFGSDAYAAGYLGSMLVRVLNEMSKARRAEFREQIARHAKELETKLLVK